MTKDDKTMSRAEKNRVAVKPWRKRFFMLLIFNIAVVLVLISLIFWPVADSDVKRYPIDLEQASSEFIVRTSKQNLNSLINAYIKQFTAGTEHQYRIELEEDVHLIGELPVFSTTVPLSVHFEPLVVENGDIILQLRSISLGLLELPNQKIMEYLGKYLPMPEWVTVNPKEEEVYIAVTEMDIKSNLKVAIQTIDLEANNLAFKFRVPYETLGIDAYEPIQ